MVQGSSLRTPKAKDVDVALFVSDKDFEAYAERCKKGITARVQNPKAAQKMLKQIDGYVAKGFLPKFAIDRISPETGFASDAHSKLEAPFGIEIDFSVMKSGSSLALYPSMELE